MIAIILIILIMLIIKSIYIEGKVNSFKYKINYKKETEDIIKTLKDINKSINDINRNYKSKSFNMELVLNIGKKYGIYNINDIEKVSNIEIEKNDLKVLADYWIQNNVNYDGFRFKIKK